MLYWESPQADLPPFSIIRASHRFRYVYAAIFLQLAVIVMLFLVLARGTLEIYRFQVRRAPPLLSCDAAR